MKTYKLKIFLIVIHLTVDMINVLLVYMHICIETPKDKLRRLVGKREIDRLERNN